MPALDLMALFAPVANPVERPAIPLTPAPAGRPPLTNKQRRLLRKENNRVKLSEDEVLRKIEQLLGVSRPPSKGAIRERACGLVWHWRIVRCRCGACYESPAFDQPLFLERYQQRMEEDGKWGKGGYVQRPTEDWRTPQVRVRTEVTKSSINFCPRCATPYFVHPNQLQLQLEAP